MSNFQKFNNLTVNSKSKIRIVPVKKIRFDNIESFKIDAPSVEARVRLSEEVRTCYNLPNLFFSNHYPINLDEGADHPYVVQAFEKLNENLDIIKLYITPIEHDKDNNKRIEEILKKYLNTEYDSYVGLFYKSDIRTGTLRSERGSFRVISLYTVEPKSHKKQRHSKHFLTILFFDPYHLFIPSVDYGTKIYDEVCNFTGHCTRLRVD